MSVVEVVTVVLAVVGVGGLVLAAVGVLRLPDVYSRMHAVGKAGTTGASIILLSVAVYERDLVVGVKVLVIIGVCFLTMPVVVHMLCRAAYLVGVAPASSTWRDELAGAYDRKARRLRSLWEEERQGARHPAVCDNGDGRVAPGADGMGD